MFVLLKPDPAEKGVVFVDKRSSSPNINEKNTKNPFPKQKNNTILMNNNNNNNLHSFVALKQTFAIDRKYEFIRELGLGAYGVVWYSHCLGVTY